jgi:hypothetical protein
LDFHNRNLEKARNIREVSSTARETVKKIHESGAITELAEAVQEAAVATKDTAKEIGSTAKEIRNSHVAATTASAIEETVKAATETIQAGENTARQVSKAAPKTTGTIKKGATKATKATKATLHQAGRGLRKVAITRPAKDKKIKRSKTKKHTPAKRQRSLRQKT